MSNPKTQPVAVSPELAAQLAQLMTLIQTVPVPVAKATALPAWIAESKAAPVAKTQAPAKPEATYRAERSEFNGIPGYTVRKMFGTSIARQKFLTDKEVAAILAVVTK